MISPYTSLNHSSSNFTNLNTTINSNNTDKKHENPFGNPIIPNYLEHLTETDIRDYLNRSFDKSLNLESRSIIKKLFAKARIINNEFIDKIILSKLKITINIVPQSSNITDSKIDITPKGIVLKLIEQHLKLPSMPGIIVKHLRHVYLFFQHVKKASNSIQPYYPDNPKECTKYGEIFMKELDQARDMEKLMKKQAKTYAEKDLCEKFVRLAKTNNNKIVYPARPGFNWKEGKIYDGFEMFNIPSLGKVKCIRFIQNVQGNMLYEAEVLDIVLYTHRIIQSIYIYAALFDNSLFYQETDAKRYEILSKEFNEEWFVKTNEYQEDAFITLEEKLMKPQVYGILKITRINSLINNSFINKTKSGINNDV